MNTIDLGKLMGRVLTGLFVASDVAGASLKERTSSGKRTSHEPAWTGGKFVVRITGSDSARVAQRALFRRYITEESEVVDLRDSCGFKWYERRFNRATTDDERRALVHAALDELLSLRQAQRGAAELSTEEGKLKVAHDTRPPVVVAAQYGVTVKHVYHLRREAQMREVPKRRYDGTLEMRCRIAAEPGSLVGVSLRYENVSASTLGRWRKALSPHV